MNTFLPCKTRASRDLRSAQRTVQNLAHVGSRARRLDRRFGFEFYINELRFAHVVDGLGQVSVTKPMSLL